MKRRDYREGGTVDASGVYGAWSSLRGSPDALSVGDLLETEDGSLSICKYVGFEEARWQAAEASLVQ